MVYFLLFVVMIYISASSLLWFLQEKFIFYPTKLNPNFQFTEFSNAEEVYLPVSESVSLHGLHFKISDPKGVVLYFHGNSQGLESWGYEAETFTKKGYDVFMPDYRGFGKSTGKLARHVLHEDATRAYHFVEKHYDAKDIILYGRSLGTGVACELATRKTARLLLMETPYLSILSLAQAQRPFLPVKWLLKYPLRNDLNILKIKCPVHLFHGTEDELIPYQHAIELTKIYGDANILTTFVGGMHGNLGDYPDFHNQLKKLLG